MRSLSLLARKDTQWFMHIDSLSDFQVVSFLGRGTFGDVFGAQSEKVVLIEWTGILIEWTVDRFRNVFCVFADGVVSCSQVP